MSQLGAQGMQDKARRGRLEAAPQASRRRGGLRLGATLGVTFALFGCNGLFGNPVPGEESGFGGDPLGTGGHPGGGQGSGGQGSGADNSGGADPTGGRAASGGGSSGGAPTGGASSSGGAETGGASSSGGSETGGASSSGGAATGGASASGGTGGMDPSGGSGGGPRFTVIGQVGDACAPDDARACVGHNQADLLLCVSGKWAADGQCPSTQRCDTRPEAPGICQDVLAECSMSSPGDAVCSGTQLLDCGPDLTTQENTQDCSGGCVSGTCTPCQPNTMAVCMTAGQKTCDQTGHYGPCILPSCSGLAATCGPNHDESCCTSPPVMGGGYERGEDASNPATIANFLLDRFEVTVGRLRKFKTAWEGGFRPTVGDGKHAHLSGGKGLQDSAAPTNYEGGWQSAWDASVALTDVTLQCSAQYQTWTPSPMGNESRPANCLNWFEAYAFCTWDGGFLPSEAEWEYASTGGADERAYPWSVPATDTTIDCNHANYFFGSDLNSNDYCYPTTITIDVGSLSPLGDGKYKQADLSGNVLEWTMDYFDTYAACTDCAALSTSSSTPKRVVRGGSFHRLAVDNRTEFRNSDVDSARFGNYGVRCGRAP